MDYAGISLLEELKKREADTEHWVDFTPRTFVTKGLARVVRLPNYVWAHFDMLTHYGIMSAEEILHDAQLGCAKAHPKRSYEDNLIIFTLAASAIFADRYR